VAGAGGQAAGVVLLGVHPGWPDGHRVFAVVGAKAARWGGLDRCPVAGWANVAI